MTTFNKVMHMPVLPNRQNFTKIQDEKVLPVVKKLANESMVNNAYKIRDESGNDDRECGVSIDGTVTPWMHKNTWMLKFYQASVSNAKSREN